MTTDLHPASLAKLVRSISILALPFASQLAWLRSIGLGEPAFADELALELEDGARLAQQFEDAGWIKPDVRKLILDLDAALAARSGPEHEDFWRMDSLRDGDEWEEIRGLATVVLLAL